jgi:hypothetical protein
MLRKGAESSGRRKGIGYSSIKQFEGLALIEAIVTTQELAER